ncbi:MAG TPA: Uma2 family endonuclease [Nostocaceae cyanobacterium]|nr:Uma2 family endonuclease [Nostocaceae cyanobacterium]
MTIKPVECLFSFEEYLIYNDGTEKRYELENGKLLEMPPAADLHEAIITFLLIKFYLEIQRLGQNLQVRPSGTGVRTKTNKSRLPDLVVMTEEQRQSIQGKSAVLEVPPVLVVEVVSAESVTRDYETKLIEYADLGITEYWIVDPLENKVTILLWDNGKFLETVFTGEQKIISRVFSELILSAEQILKAGGNSISL